MCWNLAYFLLRQGLFGNVVSLFFVCLEWLCGGEVCHWHVPYIRFVKLRSPRSGFFFFLRYCVFSEQKCWHVEADGGGHRRWQPDRHRGRCQMDSGPEGPNGHRWVGGWHPHRQHRLRRQHQDREKKKEITPPPVLLQLTTYFSMCVCVCLCIWPLNKDMCSFVCTSLHTCMLLNVSACSYICRRASLCLSLCMLSHTSPTEYTDCNKYNPVIHPPCEKLQIF